MMRHPRVLVAMTNSAQWLTQHIPLVPGWNAACLEVQPEPRECDEVFRDLPVQGVWKWDRRFATHDFSRRQLAAAWPLGRLAASYLSQARKNLWTALDIELVTVVNGPDARFVLMGTQPPSGLMLASRT